jgi:WD40 repeat protein
MAKLIQNFAAPVLDKEVSKIAIANIAFHPNGQMLAATSSSGQFFLWNLAPGKLTYIFTGHQNAVYVTASNSDGSLLATGSADNTVRCITNATFFCSMEWAGKTP